MMHGKQRIYDLPVNDITGLGAFALQFQQDAEARGVQLPPPLRLHIGEPSFRTPQHIREAAIQLIADEPLTYGPAAGWSWLRELLAEKIQRINNYRVKPSQIVNALGGTGAMLSALIATVGPGDEVLIPDPHWPQYLMQLACCGATPVTYPLDPQNEWLPDIAQLERLVTSRTRLLLINTPGNPTGAIFPASLVADLFDFARRHNLYLLSDEAYDEIVFEGEHISPAALMTPEEFNEGRVICAYTFSKTYAMTGWRIGYIVAGEQMAKTLTDIVNVSYSNISTISQRAAQAALTGPQDCVAEMCRAYQHRRDLAVRLLKERGRYIYTPHGAFYILIDITSPNGTERRGRQFGLDLLQERNITVAPGSGFGSVADHYVRVSLAASDQEIERGIREICEFADR